MRVRVLLIVAALLSSALASTPATAENCGPLMPRRLGDVRGYTFVAKLVAKHPPVGDQAPNWDFDVLKVYAGADRPTARAGRVLHEGRKTTFIMGGCYPVQHLRIGETYLVSKSDIVTFSSMTSIVWKVDRDQRTTLVLQHGGRGLAKALRKPTTVSEVLDLVLLPSDLPPTDSVQASVADLAVVALSAIPIGRLPLALTRDPAFSRG